MADAEKEQTDLTRLAVMEIVDGLAPLREMVTGELAHFERQGFTKEQARAIVAAEFVSVFGTRIESAATPPE